MGVALVPPRNQGACVSFQCKNHVPPRYTVN